MNLPHGFPCYLPVSLRHFQPLVLRTTGYPGSIRNCFFPSCKKTTTTTCLASSNILACFLSSFTPPPTYCFDTSCTDVNRTAHNCCGVEVWRHNGQVDCLVHHGTTQSQQNKWPQGVNVGRSNGSVHNKHWSNRLPSGCVCVAAAGIVAAGTPTASFEAKEGTNSSNRWCSSCCATAVVLPCSSGGNEGNK